MIGLNLGLTNACAAGHSLTAAALGRLRTYGTNAHVYLPGAGVLNGLQAANYLDSAGTTQGTVDQPVGLVLDAEGSVGADVVINGTFDNASNWSLGPQTTVSGGKATIASTGAASNLGQSGILTATSTYLVTFDAVVRSGSAKLEASGGGTFLLIDSTKSYSCYFTGTNGVIFNRVTACDIDIDNVVAREVTGIHASQSTTPSKPVLRRGAVLLNNYSKNRQSEWYGLGFVNNSATQVQFPNAAYQVITFPCSAGATYTAAAVLSGTPGEQIRMYLQDNAGAYGSTGVIITLTATPTLYVWTRTMVEAAGMVGLMWTSGATVVVDVAAQGVFQGTYTAAQIQALGGIPLTTTAPASTALGPYFWQFDGVNDSLALGSIPFTQADDHLVIFPVKCDSVTGIAAFFSASGAASQRVAQMWRNATTLTVNWQDDIGGGASISSTIALGETCIVTARKVGSTYVMRKNGVQVGTQTATLGATTLNGASIGVSGGFYWTGAIGEGVIVKGTFTDADTLTLERQAAALFPNSPAF
jgi:hypothetical protein